MSRDIYSFVKIQKDETERGIIYSAMGVASVICLVILIAVSFAGGGNLPAFSGGIAYLSFIISLVALYLSYHLRNDKEAYGPMIGSCLYVNVVAAALHLVVFLVGCFISI